MMAFGSVSRQPKRRPRSYIPTAVRFERDGDLAQPPYRDAHTVTEVERDIKRNMSLLHPARKNNVMDGPVAQRAFPEQNDSARGGQDVRPF
jgi:hypothetical protein